ncbi:hypothetical protein KR200_008486, partial [Drosophila serrata]
MWAYRSAPHEATGFSPSQLTLGRELRLPDELLYGRPFPNPESYIAFVDQLQNRLRQTQQLGRQHLIAAANVNKSPTRRVARCPKLQSDWIAPATVIRRHSDLVYEIRVPRKRTTRTVHVNRLSP